MGEFFREEGRRTTVSLMVRFDRVRKGMGSLQHSPFLLMAQKSP